MSTTTGSSLRTTAALQARRAAIDAMLERVRDALRQIRRECARITVAAVARRADVSRTFLYQNADARTLVTKAATEAAGGRLLDQTEQAAHVEAPWRERALNAEDALRLAHAEIALQRNNIGHLLGKIRDLEHDLPEDGPQRLLTENTTLKQQIRQFSQDNQRLAERLTGARDNNRFLDKRIADLEIQLAALLIVDEPTIDGLSVTEIPDPGCMTGGCLPGPRPMNLCDECRAHPVDLGEARSVLGVSGGMCPPPVRRSISMMHYLLSVQASRVTIVPFALPR